MKTDLRLRCLVRRDVTEPSARQLDSAFDRRRPRRTRSARLAPLVALAFLSFLAVFTRAPDASAYSWMIKHGYTACSTCHADPSGGELLTSYGRVTSDLILRMHYGERKEGDTPSPGVLWGAWEPPEELLISGSYRNLYVAKPGEEGSEFKFVPVMQADLYAQVKVGGFIAGGSLGIARVPEGSTHARPAQITNGTGDSLNLISRTHYVGYQFGTDVTLRAGRLNLPFGVRMPEHTSWVREATRTERESDQQHGLALAYTGKKIRAELMAIAGNFQLGPDDFRERGYSFFLEGMSGSNLAMGLSSKVTYAKIDRVTSETDSLRQAHGILARWAPFESLAFLFETDALFRTNADAGYVGFLQADYEPIQGLHFLLTGEMLDEGLAIQSPPPNASPGLGQPRAGGWISLDWFFFRQFEFRTDAVFRQDEPFTLLGQLHFYL